MIAAPTRDDETAWRLLVECRLSGQVSEAQWRRHLEDPAFADYLRRKSNLAHASVKPVSR